MFLLLLPLFVVAVDDDVAVVGSVGGVVIATAVNLFWLIVWLRLLSVLLLVADARQATGVAITFVDTPTIFHTVHPSTTWPKRLSQCWTRVTITSK